MTHEDMVRTLVADLPDDRLRQMLLAECERLARAASKELDANWRGPNHDALAGIWSRAVERVAFWDASE